jgi:flagellar assembly protein FliH
MGSATAKFMFDQDFAAVREAKPAVAVPAHETAVKEADAIGHARGFAAAMAESRVGAEHRSAAALERIAALLDDFKQELAAAEARFETEAVAVAVAIAKKLAPALIEREPVAEIAALVSGCFRHLVAAPHLVVRVSEAQQGSVGQAIEAIARERGVASHLVVLAEPEIATGDCRIEWADGGMRRDHAATEAAIDEAVSRYVEARIAAGKENVSRRSDR